jgi:hypothetical protein
VADKLVDQRDEPWPSGTESDRLHYWRDKAIKASTDLRTLLTALDGDEVELRVAVALEREFPECVDEGRMGFIKRLAKASLNAIRGMG